MKKQSLVLGMLVLAGTFLLPNAPVLADATEYATDNAVDCFYEYNQGSAACDALKLSEAEASKNMAGTESNRVAETDNAVDCFYEYNQGSAACDALKSSKAEENTKLADKKPDRVAFLMHR